MASFFANDRGRYAKGVGDLSKSCPLSIGAGDAGRDRFDRGGSGNAGFQAIDEAKVKNEKRKGKELYNR